MKVIFFTNGNVVVFDENGQQVPELQVSYLNIYLEFIIARRYQLGYPEDDIHNLDNMEFVMPDGTVMEVEISETKINKGDYIFKVKRD